MNKSCWKFDEEDKGKLIIFLGYIEMKEKNKIELNKSYIYL